MNIRISTLLMISLLLTSPHIGAITPFISPKDNLQMAIMNAHKNAFDVDRFYQKGLNSADLNEWKKTVNDLQISVARYSLNDTKLMNMYREIKKANNALLKTIANTYSSLFKSQKSIVENRYAIISTAKNTFTDIEARMMAVQEKLNALDFESKETGMIKVRDALRILALCIELTATKASKDIDKEIDLR